MKGNRIEAESYTNSHISGKGIMRGTRILKLFGLGAALVLFALAAGNSGQAGVAQPQGCTVTLNPGQSIQQAINETAEGAVICLSAGTFQENIEIKKSLTLRGTGREQTIIKGRENEKPIICMQAYPCTQSDNEIEVVLEDLTLTGTGAPRTFPPGEGGMNIGGKSKIKLIKIQVSANSFNGLTVWGASRVSVTDSQLTDNGGNGLQVGGSAEVGVTNSQISGNNYHGLSILESARVNLSNSLISDNGGGLRVEDSAQVTLQNVNVVGNEGEGLSLDNTAQLQLTRVQISGNGSIGLSMDDQVKVELDEVWISDNTMCGISFSLFKDETVTGRDIWVQYNGKDFCQNSFSPPPDFRLPEGLALRNDPPRPLLDAAEVCSQGCPFTEVGPAVWAVRSDGVIRIAPGTYRGQLVLTKNLTLEGAGREQTILTGRRDGIHIAGSAKVQLKSLQVSGNRGDGLWVLDSAQLQLIDSQVSNNGVNGLRVEDSAKLELVSSSIAGNGTNPDCTEPDTHCNGLMLLEEAVLVLKDSVIRGNTDWGLVAVLDQCGYPKGDEKFMGQVTFEGQNVIQNNSTSSNQKGKGNPGIRSFKKSIDGQVCLPQSTRIMGAQGRAGGQPPVLVGVVIVLVALAVWLLLQ